MPTYEYACEACGNNWEAEQRITAPALKECPKCGQPKARRLISGSRFVLKGGGWYADGYGSKGGAPKPSEESKPAAAAEAKTESKPAAPESKPASSSSSD
jgi:putative FmdB family regulatory protein